MIDAVTSMQHKKFTEEMRQLILNMVNNNMGKVSEIATFLNINKMKEFATLIKNIQN